MTALSNPAPDAAGRLLHDSPVRAAYARAQAAAAGAAERLWAWRGGSMARAKGKAAPLPLPPLLLLPRLLLLSGCGQAGRAGCSGQLSRRKTCPARG
mmetsp:Transcript_18608/g.52024  ORF Transcript_18608/g.52024 Transcript_18608/m.52024 type:complete len:97 (+) Transcript_18608:398-688(+)